MMLWLDGALLDAKQARLDPADRGLLLGDGVFETLAVQAGAPRHLQRHLRRLRAGAATLDIPLAWDDAALQGALAGVLRAQKLEDAAARITLTRGPGGRGVLPSTAARPTLLITAQRAARVPETVSLIVAGSTRRNEFSPLARIKSISYLDSVLARQEAVRAGAEDALLRNTQGFMAEATAANLFVLLDGALVTPRVTDGALPGIARAVLMERLGARERRIEHADLRRAQAVLLSNSLGIRTAVALGGLELARDAALEARARAALAA
jgi:branched-chain amino acid aminotransferase